MPFSEDPDSDTWPNTSASKRYKKPSRSYSSDRYLFLTPMALILPPLPKIEGDVDLILDVHTHDSLRPQDTPMNDDYGDTARLAELGAKVVDLVVTTQLFARRPCLSAEQIVVSYIIQIAKR